MTQRRVCDRYSLISRIGAGTYGCVWKGFDRVLNCEVALKQIYPERLCDVNVVPQSAIRECALLNEVRGHPNILTLLDVVLFRDGDIFELHLVFELMKQDLKAFLDDHDQRFVLPQNLVQHLMRQFLTGLAFMHSIDIVHRDLKPQNLLLSRDFCLKIADMGLGRSMSLPNRSLTHDVVTLWYRSPEILLSANQYDSAIDVWSVGCIFAEILTRKPLFPGDVEIGQLFKIFELLGTPNETVWPGVSQLPEWNREFPKFRPKDFTAAGLSVFTHSRNADARHLFLACLTYDPAQRIKAEQALALPYFAQTGERRYMANDDVNVDGAYFGTL